MDKEFFTNDHKHTLVFMDLETFNVNLNFYNNRPWQVGMIKVVRKKSADFGISFDGGVSCEGPREACIGGTDARACALY